MDDVELRHYLGKRIKNLRRLAHMTQTQMAERADLSVNYVSDIETGSASPTLKTLLNIAQALGVEMKELFTFDEHFSEK